MSYFQDAAGAAGVQAADKASQVSAEQHAAEVSLEGSYFAEHGCRSLALDALIDSVNVIAFESDPHVVAKEVDWLEGRQPGVLSSQTCFEWITSSGRDTSIARESFQSFLQRDPQKLLKALRTARSHPELVGADLDHLQADEPYTLSEMPRERFGSH